MSSISPATLQQTLSPRAKWLKSRWRRFRNNRLGYYSLLFMMLLTVLLATLELVVNDKPIVVQFEDQWYWPVMVSYPETTFGGDFLTETNYKDPYVIALIEQSGWMLWPPIRFAADTINYDLNRPAPAPPSQVNWLGTDDQGRDILARTLYGLRLSLLFAGVLTAISAIIGVVIGALQGYFGGRTDLILQRFIEVYASMPQLFILLIISSLIVPNFWWLLFILLLFSWTALVDVVRAEFLRGRTLDYVRAAKALGVSDRAIMFRHILPNAMVATLTFLPFLLNSGITTLTALDFLGFGLPPGSPSLGELLAQSKANIHATWIGLTTFVTLAVVLSMLIFIGEAVRDAFDPHQ